MAEEKSFEERAIDEMKEFAIAELTAVSKTYQDTQRAERIDHLVAAAEATGDPEARSRARELLRAELGLKA